MAHPFGIKSPLNGLRSPLGALLSSTLIPATALTVEAFDNAGGSVMMIGSQASGAGAIYLADQDVTLIAFERITKRQRSKASVIEYDHAAGTLGTVYDIDAYLDPLLDNHGQPLLHRMANNYILALGGSHDSVQPVWVSPAANDISNGFWNRMTDVPGAKTYPKAITYSGAEYVYWRETIVGAPGSRPIVMRSATASGSSLNLAAASQSTIVEFGNDTRTYAGEMFLRNSDEVHFVATKADWNDTVREDIFYYRHQLSTGDVLNYDGTTTIALADLPVDLTESEADFRIHATGSNRTSHPVLQFDSDGNPHILWLEGTGTAFQLYHMWDSGSGFTTPESIASLTDNDGATAFVRHIMLVPAANGRMWALYPQSFTGTNRGGKQMARRIWNGASWAAEEILETISTSGVELANPQSVKEGASELRALYMTAQVSQDYSSPIETGLRMFGDSRFIQPNEPQAFEYPVGNDVFRIQPTNNAQVRDVVGTFVPTVANDFTNTDVTIDGANLDFNGTSSNIEMPTSGFFTLDGDFTIQWEDLVFDNNTGTISLIAHGDYSTTNDAWRLFHNATSFLWQTDDGAGLGTRLSHALARWTSSPRDVALERKDGTIRLFIDDLTSGNEVASASWSATPNTSDQPCLVGAEYTSAEPGDRRRYMAGQFSRVRFTHEALITA